jgi:hypothetical protein
VRLKRGLLALLAIFLLVLGAWLLVRAGRTLRVDIDLAAAFSTAEKRSSLPDAGKAFGIEPVTLAGVRRQGILARPTSRITWAVTVPEGAMLETAYGMREDSWDKPGSNGAQFRIGIASGSTYEELARHYVNPRAVRSDRKWQNVVLDLSRYAGRAVRIVFSTEPGPPPGASAVDEACVWSDPRVVSGR